MANKHQHGSQPLDLGLNMHKVGLDIFKKGLSIFKIGFNTWIWVSTPSKMGLALGCCIKQIAQHCILFINN